MRSGIVTCPKHNRWVRFHDARRACPECPLPRARRFRHLPTGRIIAPAAFGRFIEKQGDS